jgi:4-amino-4-deoxy-L-arabinose transferase-like glycosyltransferase
MPRAFVRWRCLRPYGLLALLCLALYLPGIAAIPPLDRDEARFAQATRQMLQTGDFLRIRFQNAARNNKPAGIYWLQAASVSALSTARSTAIWPYRVPSLLGAAGAVLLTFAFGAAFFADRPQPRRLAVIAGVLLAASLGLVAEAHIAKTDAALLAAIVAGQGALGLAYLGARAGRPARTWIAAVFWAAEAAAIFLKGPVGPSIAIATAAALSLADRDWRWLRTLRPAWGLFALAVAVAPWLVTIERATEGRFLAASLGHDFFRKLAAAQESHGAPPLTYLTAALVTFWPGSLLLVPALWRGWRRRRVPAERFLLAWLLPAWAALELIPTKLPNYALPLYPALALLAAAALAEGVRLPAGWLRRLDLAVRGVWLVASLGLAALLIVLPWRFGGRPAAIDAIGAALVLALAAALLIRRRGAGGTAGLFAALSLAFALPAGFGVLPGLDRLWLSRAAAALVAHHPPAAGTPVVAVGYSEPSLVFLCGTGLRLATPEAAAAALGQGGEALVSGHDDARFRQALAAGGLGARPLGRVAGLDYSNDRQTVLTLYRVAPVR